MVLDKDIGQVEMFKPPVCRNMRVLDRSFFKKTVPLAAAKVMPKTIPEFKQQCARDLLRVPRIKSVYEADGQKLVVLRPEISSLDISLLQHESQAFISKHDIKIIPFSLNLEYSYWQTEDILSAVLPEDLLEDQPAGFTMVGHIAHLNLRDEYLPFKKLIGQVILDKNVSIRTVVNKLDTIDSVYRNFQMEVLAGEQDFIAEQSESGCRFKFDFSKVYWNSRLHTEHDRLIQKFHKGEAVCDVMAGVGPFAVPAGKKGVIVFANDLNPASYESLVENIALNKVDKFVTASNVDGRAYIRQSVGTLLERSRGSPITVYAKRLPRSKPSPLPDAIPVPQVFNHYVMNLPATAIEFLDAFRGIYAGYENLFEERKLPMVHVHCFSKFDPPDEDLEQRLSEALGFVMKSEVIDYHFVRKVAPNKDMYCCSFRLPKQVIFASGDTPIRLT